jgi:TfoX/Sxy family transcriptional regulator of competence genes
MAFDEDLANRLRELLQSEPGLTERRMFGGLAFLVDGNMAVSASGQGGLLLRVDPAQTLDLLRQRHAKPSAMRGREMDGWLRVHAEGLKTKGQLERWVNIGLAFARSLPAKDQRRGAKPPR